MNIRIAGYQLTFHDEYDMDRLVVSLQRHQNTRFHFAPHSRLLRVARDGDHIYGLLLTDRGHKNFLAIDTSTNELTLGSLGARKNFGAFNFFVLCKTTNTALITIYRDAGGPSFVFGAMQRFGDQDLVADYQQEIATAGPGITTRQRTEILERFEPPCFEWREIVGRETYEASLKKWEKIRSVDIEYQLLDSGTASFLPFRSNDVDNGKVKLSFKRGTTVAAAVDYIKSLWRSRPVSDAESLKVDGIDDWGISRRVELEENIPRLFGQLGHDDIIADPSSFQQNLKQSFVIKYMRDVIANAPSVFGKAHDANN